jgi:hypothetical protein
MARSRRFRPGPVAVAFALYDVWRHLPPKQRQQVVDIAREHGPRVAARVLELRRARRR